MKVLITGDRHWKDAAVVAEAMTTLHIDDVVIQGGAPGADTEAHTWAVAHGCTSITVPARWDVYGRAAGPIRNQKMLKDWEPDLVMYFHDNLTESKGTKHMIETAQRHGIKVVNGRKMLNA